MYPSLAREQVVAYRLEGQQLTGRARSADLTAVAGRCYSQNTPPGSAACTSARTLRQMACCQPGSGSIYASTRISWVVSAMVEAVYRRVTTATARRAKSHLRQADSRGYHEARCLPCPHPCPFR